MLRMQPEPPQLPLLEQHLLGCRTKRTDPIPYVNVSKSLDVLDTYTAEQRAAAANYTAAVAACDSFQCLQRANELVRGRGGGAAAPAMGTQGCRALPAAHGSAPPPPPLQPRAPGQFPYPHFFILGATPAALLLLQRRQKLRACLDAPASCTHSSALVGCPLQASPSAPPRRCSGEPYMARATTAQHGGSGAAAGGLRAAVNPCPVPPRLLPPSCSHLIQHPQIQFPLKKARECLQQCAGCVAMLCTGGA